MSDRRNEIEKALTCYKMNFSKNINEFSDNILTDNDISAFKVELGISELHDDYVWMLKKYGYLDLYGCTILGVNKYKSFVTETMNARMEPYDSLRNEEYGDYALDHDYIVLDHEDGDGETDLVMNVRSGDVFEWEYLVNKYIPFDKYGHSGFLSYLEFRIYSDFDMLNFEYDFPDDWY